MILRQDDISEGCDKIFDDGLEPKSINILE